MYDTIVVGAGPVGSYLARKLTQLGHKVLVLEKKAALGQDICCTGIVGKECFNLLAIDNSLIIRQVSSAKFVAPSGKLVRLCRNDAVAYVIDRSALEIVLGNRAQASGAEYRFNTQATEIQIRTDYLTVTADSHGHKEQFAAETAVLATGFGSPLPEKLGLGRINDFIFGGQAGVDVTGVDEIEVYFDQRLAPSGFAWLVPTKGNKGLAGLITRHKPEWHLSRLLSNLEAWGKIRSSAVTPSYGVIPLRPLPKTYNEKILAVGETAGQVKPITGGGIFYGLLCADIAADSLHQALETGDLSKRRLASYQKQWQARLGKELQISYWVRRLCERLDNQQVERLHNFVANNGVAKFITELEDFPFDWHSKIVSKMLKHFTFPVPRRVMESSLSQEISPD